MADGLILVTAWRGQPQVDELERQARDGVRPRTDYVELARLLDAEVVDDAYIRSRATALARAAGRVAGHVQGQVVEALVRERRCRWMLAWADGLGFRLAAARAVLPHRAKLVVVSVRLATPTKRLALGPLALHRRIDAIVNYGSVQRAWACERGVPGRKLHLLLQPVDQRFWQQPAGMADDGVVCAVGSEARDYETFLAAVRGLPVRVELAVGSSVLDGSREQLARAVDAASGVVVHRQLSHLELRELYRRARVVVVPLRDVDYDAGVTAITEALAMGKPLVVTRARGQVDVVQDEEHAVLVPPGSPDALRSAILRLLDDGALRSRMGRAGRRLAEERHSLDAYVRGLAEIVHDVVGGATR